MLSGTSGEFRFTYGQPIFYRGVRVFVLNSLAFTRNVYFLSNTLFHIQFSISRSLFWNAGRKSVKCICIFIANLSEFMCSNKNILMINNVN